MNMSKRGLLDGDHQPLLLGGAAAKHWKAGLASLRDPTSKLVSIKKIQKRWCLNGQIAIPINCGPKYDL